MDNLGNIMFALTELEQDNSTPKNVKLKVNNVLKFLNTEGSDMSIRISKALCELDELSKDTNMQSYTRAQLFNIVSLLESF